MSSPLPPRIAVPPVGTRSLVQDFRTIDQLLCSSRQARPCQKPSWPSHSSVTLTYLITSHQEACGRWPRLTLRRPVSPSWICESHHSSCPRRWELVVVPFWMIWSNTISRIHFPIYLITTDWPHARHSPQHCTMVLWNQKVEDIGTGSRNSWSDHQEAC